MKGIPEKTLGKLSGQYLGMIYSQIYELERLGLIARIGRNRDIIMTEKGYSYSESPLRQITDFDGASMGVSLGKWAKRNWVLITLLISIIAGLIVAIIVGQWKPW